jgi:hypothetical protein
LLFPAGTDARRKCESGGFIRFVKHYIIILPFFESISKIFSFEKFI